MRRYPGNPIKTKNLSKKEIRSKTYQKFVKDFLRSGAAIDDNIVKILDYLEKENLIENTVIIYTSDQGYFLGEHGYMDKRWFYEESSKMPFVVSYPKLFEQNKRISDLFLNIDIPSFFLDLAEIKKPKSFQGLSFKNRLTGNHYDSRDFIYYRYWQHEVKRPAHLGIRSKNHKLIYVYGDGLNKSGVQNEKTIPTWEFYDLKIDPKENRNRINDRNYIEIIKKLRKTTNY